MSMRKWTEEEVLYLIESYKTMSYADIGTYLGRTTASIYLKASSLGLVKKDFNSLSEKEERYVKQHYKNEPVSNIAEVLCVPKSKVKSSIRKLGLQKNSGGNKKWSKKDISFLVRNYDTLGYKKISSILGRSYSSVRLKASRLNIADSRKNKVKKWTEQEIEFLQKNYTRPAYELAEHLNRTISSIYHKLGSLGLSVPTTIDLYNVRKEFEALGWELLSTEYMGSHEKLEYICDNGHHHYITWNKFKERKKCPKCSYDRDDFFNKVKRFCRKLGYTVLSDTYVNSKTPLYIICSNGHSFYMTWNSVSIGSRCQQCMKSKKISKPEKVLAEQIKDFLGAEKVLENVKKVIYPYELDIYIPSKKLAVEYCGLYWHSEKHGKDKLYHKTKYDLCKKSGIKLITLFEDEYDLYPDLVFDKIKKELKRRKSTSLLGADVSYVFCTGDNEFIENHSFLNPSKDLRCLLVLNSTEDVLGGFVYTQNESLLEILSVDEAVGIRLFDEAEIFRGAIEKMVKKYNPRVVTYKSDLRWTDANVDRFTTIGFKFLESVEPQYSYIFKHRRTTKQRNLPNGRVLNKIWDCGYNKYCLITGG